MLVEMWMTRDPITILPGTAISEAALVMARHRIRRLVVVDHHPDGRVVGMVSAGDVALAFPPYVNPASAVVTERSLPAPVATIMSRTVQTIATGAGIDEAARRLLDRYFDRRVELARGRLRAARRGPADEEDAALSAFHSLCEGGAAGRFPRLEGRPDL